MKTQSMIRRQIVAACASAVALCGVLGVSTQAIAQTKIPMRISTPAVPDDWHAKMWTVFKENLDKSSANQRSLHPLAIQVVIRLWLLRYS